jgi:hypothetical protein
LRDEHSLVVVVAVAVVADGDRVRVAAGAHAADDFAGREPYHGDVARRVPRDERVSPVGRDRDATRLDAHIERSTQRDRCRGGQVDRAHRAVDGVGDVGARVVRRDRDETRLPADRHLREQLRRVGPVGIAHPDHRDARLLAIHDDSPRVVAGQSDARRSCLPEQQTVAGEHFVAAHERAVQRGGERRDHAVVREARGGEVDRARARDRGGDGVHGRGLDLESVGGVVVGIEQREQAQQVR